MSRTGARRTASSAALLAGLLVTHPAVTPDDAENRSPAAAVHITTPQPRSWAETAGRFLDHALGDQLAFHGIPGAAVAVVQGSRILHLGGYGHADLEKRKPVSAETTLFRTGSVSKLFTWTAVMQLVDQGRLDLQADVNQYLSAFQIPETYSEPITLAHLLTHTAGFEERAFGFYARTSRDLVPLDRFLAAHMPAQIFPPGEVSAYSNYGAALAGYLVEQVSGVPFEEYVETQILAPLGMADSSFRQPLPPALAAHPATGYRASLQPGDFELSLAAPAGALSTTAADMARFMITHLQLGRLDTTRILGVQTAQAMQQRRFTNHPAVSGLTYGFHELDIAGQRVLAQAGDMLHFTAALFLLPEHDLGLYVAYNRGRAADLPMALVFGFIGRFFPAHSWLLPEPLPISHTDVSRFAGSYRSTRHNARGLEKLQDFFSPVRVRVAGPGALHISGLKVVPESLWKETEPRVFRDRSNLQILAFREDASGRAIHLFEGNSPIAGYTRLPWYGAPAIHYVLLTICLPLFRVVPASVRDPLTTG